MREVIWITIENDKHDICLTYNEVKETNRCKHKYILAQTHVAPGMKISFFPPNQSPLSLNLQPYPTLVLDFWLSSEKQISQSPYKVSNVQ